MRYLAPAIFVVILVGLIHLSKEHWGRAGQLWFLGTLLFLWLLSWLVMKHFQKRLRDLQAEQERRR